MDTIKNVGLFFKDGYIHLNITTHEKKRFRCSSSYRDTPANRKKVEREKYSIAEVYIESKSPTTGDKLVKDTYLEAMRSGKSERADYVQEDYENIIKNKVLKHIGHLKISEVKRMHIEKIKSECIESGMSQSRWNKVLTSCNLIFKHYYDNEIILKNPVSLVKRSSKQFAKPNNSGKYYTSEEVSLMLEHAKGWLNPLLHLLFLGGLRLGEAMGITWDALCYDENYILVAHSSRRRVIKETKTGTIRKVLMPLKLKQSLQAHYENRSSDTFVFPNPKTGRPFYGSNGITKTYFKPLLRELGIEDRTLTVARATYATTLIQKNVPMTFIQKMLGHSKLSTTMDFYAKNGLIDSTEMVPALDQMYSA